MQIINTAFFNHRNSHPLVSPPRGTLDDALHLTCDYLEARFSSFLFFFFHHRCKKKKKEENATGITVVFVLVDVIAHECKIVVNWSELGNHSSPWLRGRIAPSCDTTIFETVLINIANPAINLAKFQSPCARAHDP